MLLSHCFCCLNCLTGNNVQYYQPVATTTCHAFMYLLCHIFNVFFSSRSRRNTGPRNPTLDFLSCDNVYLNIVFL